MSRKVRRVPFHLDAGGVKPLPPEEIRAILRGADDLIMRGGRNLLTKDKPRDLILLLLDKLEATGDRKYVPLLEAWERVDYKKVRQRIRQVITRLRPSAS